MARAFRVVFVLGNWLHVFVSRCDWFIALSIEIGQKSKVTGPGFTAVVDRPMCPFAQTRPALEEHITSPKNVCTESFV